MLLNLTGDAITFGRACIVPENALPACVNQHVAIVRVDPEQAVAGYVLSYLTHPLVKPYIESFNAGGSRRAITKGHIESFMIPLPTRDEQQAIAVILSTLDDKIELNRQMNETLEAMARQLFRDWFVDFGPTRAKMEGRPPYLAPDIWYLFPDHLDDEGKPEGWEIGSLIDIADVLMGASPSGDTYNDQGIGTPLVNGPVEYGDYFLRRIKWTTAPGRLSQRGDLIICVRGSTTGRHAFADGEYCLGRGVAAVRARKDRQEFVDLSVLTQMDRLLQKTTGSVFPNLGSDDLRGFETIVPRDDVLDVFGTSIRPMQQRIWANVEESHTLATLRDTLLPKLMSGEVRIKDAEKLVEEVV